MALTRASLMTLEAYAKARPSLRAAIIAHKNARRVYLGEHVSLLFEDENTVRYQIQEMLQVERIFEEKAIQAELDAYMPLVPDGSNLKATMLLEYPGRDEQMSALTKLVGIENRMFIQIEGQPRIGAIANEALDRAKDRQTSAVHFLRFELPPESKRALKQGAKLTLGCDHPNYPAQLDGFPPATIVSLLADLAPD